MAIGATNLAIDPCEAHYAYCNEAKIQAETINKHQEETQELDLETFEEGICSYSNTNGKPMATSARKVQDPLNQVDPVVQDASSLNQAPKPVKTANAPIHNVALASCEELAQELACL